MLTPQDIAIAVARVNGATLRDIEPIVGLDHSNVGRKLNTEQIKSLIDQLNHNLINTSLQTATENIQLAIDQYKPQAQAKPKDRDSQLREHGFKASQRILEAVGILPSHAPSVMIQNIYNGNTIVSNDLGKLLTSIFQPEPVTITYDSGGNPWQYPG